MSNILVVDDRAINRQLLVTLLSYGGHHLIEAANGIEALAQMHGTHTDLVITDLFMPQMDGMEFVKQMRADPALAATPVIFYTATHRVRDAQAMGAQHGVKHVLAKPAEPDVILATVQDVLSTVTPRPANNGVAPTSPKPASSDAPLAAPDLTTAQAIGMRLVAMVELGLDLLLERDPLRMLDTVCHAARKIIGARYAALGLLDLDEQNFQHFFVHTVEEPVQEDLEPPALDFGLICQLLTSPEPLRLGAIADAQAAGFAVGHPPLRSFLGVPIFATDHQLGVLYFVDRLAADTFDSEDEWMATTLAAETALLYENSHLYHLLQRNANNLQFEVLERKQAEEQLRETNQTLQTLIEASPLAICSFDQEGNLQTWNPAAERLFGWRAEEVIGRQPPFVTTQDQAQFERFRQRALAGNMLVDVELQRTRKDGARIDVSLAAAPLRNGEGVVNGWLALYGDISERKRHAREQEALLAMAAAMRKARNRAELLPVVLDKVMQLFEGEGAFLMLLDAASGELVTEAATGAPAGYWGYRLPPGEGISWQVMMTRQSYVSTDASAEPLLRPPAGAVEMRAAACVPLIATHGEAIGVLWISREQPISNAEVGMLKAISDMAANALYRVTLSEQTQAQARQLQHVMDTVPEGLLLLDSERRIQLMNPAAASYLAVLTHARIGDQLTELGGRPIHELLAPPLAGQPHHEVVIEQPRRRIFEIAPNTMQESSDKEAWLLVLRDVTEARHVQERIQEQARLAAVGQLVAGIAHDFNNVLAVVTLTTELLQIRLPDIPSAERQRLELVYGAVSQATQLIRQLLDFSRRSILMRGPVDLLPFLREQLGMLKRTLPENITFRLVQDRNQYVVNADPTRLMQVLMNLAINARDAMESGGTLTFTLCELSASSDELAPELLMTSNRWLHLMVADTGAGIVPEVLPHIFEPFFTTKSPGKGTGLGLAQVYGIINQHDGFVTVESEVGEGTTFHIYLPLVDQPPMVVETSADSPFARSRGETILIVDDEVATRKVIADILDELGYQVLTAKGNREALALIAEQPERIDLVISDLMMSEQGGIALSTTVQLLWPDLKIIIMSGYPLTDEERIELSAGVAAWLQKPFTSQHLATTVRTVLDLPAPQS
jgi:two-component system cell cycle sensor histidine kinase/response regulator CckA